MRTARLLLVVAVLAGLGVLLVGCGGGDTYLIGKDQEIQIGQDAAAQYEQEHPVDKTSDRARWLARIGARVAAAAQPPDYPYEFTLVREDVNNAFAYPGGPIYIYDGLIDTLGADEDQVAWVCAHEATHVREQHAIKRIERALGAQLLIEWLLGGDTTKDIAAAVTGLAMQHYSRDNEYAADRLGCQWAAGAGYDPTASLAVLQKFRELQGSDPNDFEILFHSHPGNDDRADNVRGYLTKQSYSGQYFTGRSSKR